MQHDEASHEITPFIYFSHYYDGKSYNTNKTLLQADDNKSYERTAIIFFPWLGSLAARAKWLPSKTGPYNINLLIVNNKVSCHKAKGPFDELFMSKKLTIIFALLLIVIV